jgi:glycosyltransferase involved in cell wall biosynthesis
MISGFMIVKDVLRQGYPFVESIMAALPICDEFLISDGYSQDGTYEVIDKIASLNSKVKVSRDQWPNKRNVTVLTDVTNTLRARCRCDYILSLQANEVIHEQSAPYIKAFPNIFPNVNTFSFPFVQFLDKYKFAEGFRLRLSKNDPNIVAKGDAWTLGTSDSFNRSKILKSIVRPRRFYYYLAKGVEFVHANPCYDYLSRAMFLPNPIFRYWALFPNDFLEKCQRHRELFQMAKFTKSYEELEKNVEDPEVFWPLAAEFLEHTKDQHYPKPFDSIDRSQHPAIMQEFISSSKSKQYYVREELYKQIKYL